MNFKKGSTYLVKIIAFLLLFFFARFIGIEFKAHNLSYGRKSNSIRDSANIPIIEKFMYSQFVNTKTLGNQWLNDRKEPKIGEVLHVWKLVIPKDNETLHEEKDAFRKKDKNGITYQFNLFSTLEKNIIVKQEGILFERSNSNKTLTEINGTKLDSLVKDWGITNMN